MGKIWLWNSIFPFEKLKDNIMLASYLLRIYLQKAEHAIFQMYAHV